MRPGEGGLDHEQIDACLPEPLFLPEQRLKIGCRLPEGIERHVRHRAGHSKLFGQIPGGGWLVRQNFRKLKEHSSALLQIVC